MAERGAHQVLEGEFFPESLEVVDHLVGGAADDDVADVAFDGIFLELVGFGEGAGVLGLFVRSGGAGALRR